MDVDQIRDSTSEQPRRLLPSTSRKKQVAMKTKMLPIRSQQEMNIQRMGREEQNRNSMKQSRRRNRLIWGNVFYFSFSIGHRPISRATLQEALFKESILHQLPVSSLSWHHSRPQLLRRNYSTLFYCKAHRVVLSGTQAASMHEFGADHVSPIVDDRAA